MAGKLTDYRAKRNFVATSEPKGKASSRKSEKKLIFVVQKHQASHLHYDFRLEWDGTLVSWAVPKGPSLNPAVKRLAMQVEDHPSNYASFDGVIPQRNYGGGTVMVWDYGTWEPENDAADSLERGELKFTLHGKKLRDSWVLVRTGKAGTRSKWLLIKHRDDSATEEEITEKTKSALSRRSMASIAAANGGDVERARESLIFLNTSAA